MLVESKGLQYSSFSIFIECGKKIRNKNFKDENVVLKRCFIFLSFQFKFLGVGCFFVVSPAMSSKLNWREIFRT